MKKITFIVLTFLATVIATYAQTASKVGNNPTIFDNTAVFEIESTNKGLLIPRMTTAQRDSIVSPANGLIIFNTSINGIQSYNGTQLLWNNLGGGRFWCY